MQRFNGDIEKVEKVVARRMAGALHKPQRGGQRGGRWAGMDEDKIRAILTIRFKGNEEKVNKIVARCVSGAQPQPRPGFLGKGFWASLSEEDLEKVLQIRFDGDQEKITHFMEKRAARQTARAANAAADSACGAESPSMDKLRQMLLVRFSGDEERVEQVLAMRKRPIGRGGRHMMARLCFGPLRRDAPAVSDEQARQMLLIKFDGDIEKVDRFMSRRAPWKNCQRQARGVTASN